MNTFFQLFLWHHSINTWMGGNVTSECCYHGFPLKCGCSSVGIAVKRIVIVNYLFNHCCFSWIWKELYSVDLPFLTHSCLQNFVFFTIFCAGKRKSCIKCWADYVMLFDMYSICLLILLALGFKIITPRSM
jgi:hypothetical protein